MMRHRRANKCIGGIPPSPEEAAAIALEKQKREETARMVRAIRESKAAEEDASTTKAGSESRYERA